MAGLPPGPQPRTKLGLSGLGAVGGPVGVGAGGLRVIVEFLTQYDPKAAKQAEAEIERLERNEKRSQAGLQDNLKKQSRLESQIRTAKASRAALSTQERGVLREINRELFRAERMTGQAQVDALRALKKKEDAFIATSKLTRAELTTLREEDKIRRHINQLKRGEAVIDRNSVQRQKQIADAQETILSQQQLKQQLPQRLGALALGAVGNIFGGALIGVGFQAATELLDALSNKFQDLVDPSRHAREEIAGVAEAVDRLAQSDGLNLTEAALKRIKQIGPIGEAFDIEARALAGATALGNVLQKFEALKPILDVINNKEEIRKRLASELTDVLIRQAQEAGNLKTISVQSTQGFFSGISQGRTALDGMLGSLQGTGESLVEMADRAYYAEIANQQLSGALFEEAFAHTEAGDAAREAAKAEADAAYQAARAASIASGVAAAFQAQSDALRALAQEEINFFSTYYDQQHAAVQARADANIAAIQNRANAAIKALQEQLRALSNVGPSARTKALQAALERLSDIGPSPRTKALEKALDQLANNERARQFNEEKRAIAEARNLLLLEKRLRLAKQDIDITKYTGEARIVAIDAQIDRLQRAGELQSRYNKLLELQYRMSQRIRRQEGESIRDFIERRAQEQRALLSERADLDREIRVDRLQNEKDRIQLELELRENAEARKELLQRRALERQEARLQRLLAASRRTDQRILDSKRKALQRELEASRQADQAALESRREAIQRQIDAIRDGEEKAIAAIRAGGGNAVDTNRDAHGKILGSTRDTYNNIVETVRNANQLEVISTRDAAGNVVQSYRDRNGDMLTVTRDSNGKILAATRTTYGDVKDSITGNFQKVVEEYRVVDGDILRVVRHTTAEEKEAHRDVRTDHLTSVRLMKRDHIDNAEEAAGGAKKAYSTGEVETTTSIREKQEARNEEIRRRLQKQIDQAKSTYDAVTAMSTDAEVAKIKAAIAGAKSAEDLNAAAGGFGAAEFSLEALTATIKAMGLPKEQTAYLISTATNLRNLYLSKMRSFKPEVAPPPPIHRPPGPMARGGVFELTNSHFMGRDLRVGEEGRELGLVLNNDVYRAVREWGRSQSPTGIGSVTINRSDNPMRDEFLFRKVVREEIRRALH